MFDIASCKCNLDLVCVCEKDRKVPRLEHTFLKDQRTVRKMQIGRTDVTETRRKHKRIRSSKTVTKKSHLNIHSDDSYEHQEILNSNNTDSSCSTDISFQLKRPPTKREKKSMNHVELPNVANICDRYSISDRAAASLTSAVLEDYGIITNDNTDNIVDRNKIRRAKEKFRSALFYEPEKLMGLYFDGRKDRTKQIEKLENCHLQKFIVEEHVVLVEEPGSAYIGHVTPTSGSASNIVNAILDFLKNNDISTDSLVAIGCDGTATNTGNI